MAWRRSGDKSFSEPMMASLLTHVCVTRPQRVEPMFPCDTHPMRFFRQSFTKRYFKIIYSKFQTCLFWASELNALSFCYMYDTNTIIDKYDIGFCTVDMQLCSQLQLIHWGWDLSAAISQTTFMNAFSSVKIFVFWLKFHWSLFVSKSPIDNMPALVQMLIN